MISKFKLILMEVIGVFLVLTLGIQLKLIRLKNQRQLEKEKIIEINKEKNNEKNKNDIVDILTLDNDFNISKLENHEEKFWVGDINFNETLEEGLKKVTYLIKKDFTITDYKVEYKDGYGNFNLKIRAGD